MKRKTGFMGWASRGIAVLLVLNVATPAGAVVAVGQPLKKEVDARIALAARRAARERAHRVESRELTEKEQSGLRGKAGGHPYLAGQSKWDVVYKGIDLMTGAYTTSVTDLSFEEGYGIPVNVTRSYNSNTKDEGPFGWGWTLSADLRSTAGGLLKSGSGPVRSVPTNFKERPIAEFDPNLPTGTQPAEAVVSTDAGGTEETIQKDVDGILNTPPWDKNEMEAEYENVTVSGAVYQILKKNFVHTPEGTVYEYAKEGSYEDGGTRPWDNPSATPSPANVLKIVKATDRHGNETTYEYGSGWVYFQKSNGVTKEHPLTAVQMPNGHRIEFVWANSSATQSRDRIVEVRNMVGTTVGKTWHYTYADDGGGDPGTAFLTTVTTPGGKETVYGYGAATTYSGWTGGVATGLLTSIRDHRHLLTTMGYLMGLQEVAPYGASVPSAACRRIVQPNGVYVINTMQVVPDTGGWLPGATVGLGSGATAIWEERIGGTGGALLSSGGVSGLQTSPYDVPSYEVKQYAFYAANDQRLQSWKQYHALSQDLLWAQETTFPYAHSDLADDRALRDSIAGEGAAKATRTERWAVANFMGNPLRETVIESTQTSGSSFAQSRSTLTTEYAYWDADKYYQRKAVRAPSGVYSYTDYYPDTAATGSKGMTYRVYAPQYTTFDDSKEATTNVGNAWKYAMAPSSTSPHAGEMAYDAKGRVVDSYKLRTLASGGSPAVYTRTHTTYGADASPTWGGATMVVEDYGGIGRTTQTLAFDETGKPEITSNAKGETFTTHRHADGETDYIDYSDGSVSKRLVQYDYNTSTSDWSTYWMPIAVHDLSLMNGGLGVDVTQSFIYYSGASSPGASSLGQVENVTETRTVYSPDGPDPGSSPDASSETYSVGYDYDAAGNRSHATYDTPSGVQDWEYADYATVGSSLEPKQVFQTLRKLQSGDPTAEESHYDYDGSGRLRRAAFAQTPEDPTTPPTGSDPWYTATRLPIARCVADYTYDSGGRPTKLAHWWQNRSGSTWTREALVQDECAYETSGLNRGVKTSSTYSLKSASDPTQFAWAKSDAYAYETDTGYLSAWTPYGGTTKTWTYDPSGNRKEGSAAVAYDALNRQTAFNSTTSYTVDVLGNRLTRTAGSSTTTYAWDGSGRMAYVANPNGYENWYEYRADGLRTAQKRQYGTNAPRVTKWRYDGTMPMEEVYTVGSTTETTRWSLGPRGTESQSLTTSSGTVLSYPLYDAHGNAIGQLKRGSSLGTYSLDDLRSYDPWGQVLTSGAGARPVQGFCASLGHRRDDETGLVYMRARYYDPQAGRFISEDPAMDGVNWFAYCDNDPVNLVDSTGKSPEGYKQWLLITMILAIAAGAIYEEGNIIPAVSMLALACGAAAKALGESNLIEKKYMNALWGTGGLITLAGILEGKKWLDKDSRTQIVSDLVTMYVLEIVAALTLITYEEIT